MCGQNSLFNEAPTSRWAIDHPIPTPLHEYMIFHMVVPLQIHADEKNHFCEHCPLSFRHKSSLVRHMFLHTGERPYRCQSCQSSFTARDRLKGHILKHHPDHPAAQELHSLSKMQQEAPEPNDSAKTNNNHKRRKRKHECSSPLPPSPPPVVATEAAGQQTLTSPASSSENSNHSAEAAASTPAQPTTTANIILQWPATLQVDSDGNLCWQATSLDAGTHFNEVSTVSTTAMPPFSQILIQQETAAVSLPAQHHQVQNPLDVAIKEIIEVDPVELELASQVTRFADKLRALRQQQCEATKGVITVVEFLGVSGEIL